MERLRLTEGNMAECVSFAADVLRAGGVILYPTDTLYGLGADALSDEAVTKIYEIKGRDEKKPMHAIIADLEMAKIYADIGSAARMLAKEFLPGALTLVLQKHARINTGIARGIETIGLRIPDSAFCLALAKEFGKPYTATSANKAGRESVFDIEGILLQLGSASERIDLIIDAGTLHVGRPSTVVDVSGAHPIILREGAIAAADIWNALRTES